MKNSEQICMSMCMIKQNFVQIKDEVKVNAIHCISISNSKNGTTDWFVGLIWCCTAEWDCLG